MNDDITSHQDFVDALAAGRTVALPTPAAPVAQVITQPAPAPAVTDDSIKEYRKANAAALYDHAHADHRRAVDGLTKLTESRYAQPGDQSNVEQPRTPPTLESEMTAALQPCKPEEFEIGQNSRWANNLPHAVLDNGWDADTEANARHWMSKAEMNQSQGQNVATAFGEALAKDFSPEYTAANEAASMWFLQDRYGDTDAALTAGRRVVAEIGGQQLKDWLNNTGLGSHPRIVRELMAVAERRNYIQRKQR